MMKPIFRSPKWQNLIFPIVFSFFASTALTYFLWMRTSNIFSLFFLLLLFPMFRKGLCVKKRNVCIAALVCGGLFTLFLFFTRLGYLIDLDRPIYATYVGLMFLLGFFALFYFLTAILFDRLLGQKLTSEKTESITPKRRAIVFFATIGILVLCYLPYFLRAYPGNMTPDSIVQFTQAVNNGPYHNHHPFIHTVVIRLFYSIGMALFHNQTRAVAFYSFNQMILLSASFAYLILTLYEKGAKKWTTIVILCAFALIPYHGVYSVTMWKDIWFGGIVLVLSVTLWRLFDKIKDNHSKFPLFESIMLFLFGIAMCLFRSNGLYAFILLAPCLLFALYKKNVIVALLPIVALLIALIVKGPIYQKIGVRQSDLIESLSIPAQQIARTIKDGASLKEDQYELLSHVVEVEKIPERYVSFISDSIKELVRETDNQSYISEHRGDFIKLYLNLGFHHPSSYLRALIDQTYGYWDPDVQYWVFEEGDDNIIGNGFVLFKSSKLPKGATYLLDKYKKIYIDTPQIGILWSIGACSWACIFMGCLCVLKREKVYLIVYLPVLAVLATLMIATPVYAEFRYSYSMFTTIPLLCMLPFLGKDTLSTVPPEVVQSTDKDAEK